MNNIKVSKNFNLSEFEDKRADNVVLLDERIIPILQQIRDEIGKPIIITSGYRSSKTHIQIYKDLYGEFWTDKITWHSSHLTGKAVDIAIKGGEHSDYLKVLQIAKNSGVIKGIGNGIRRGFIHLDVRDSDEIIEWDY